MFARSNRTPIAWPALVGMALAVTNGALGQEAEEESPVKKKFVVEVAPGAEPAEVNVEGVFAVNPSASQVLVRRGRQSKYWVGLAMARADETLRSQLGIKHGVVITDIVDDSPAAKGGLQKHDVVLSIGESTVADPDDVVQAIDEAGKKEVTFKVLRGGKEVTSEVTPGDHPAEGDHSYDLMILGGEPGTQLRYRFVQPGVIATRRLGSRLSTMLGVMPALPSDLTISITRTGKEPAQIVVNRDGEQWEVTEEELQELPKDIRPHAERMLGRPPALGAIFAERRAKSGGGAKSRIEKRFRVREARIAKRLATKPATTDERLDQLSKQVEQLQKALEALRSSLPADQNEEGSGSGKEDEDGFFDNH